MPTEQAQKFLDWSATELSGDPPRARAIIEEYAGSREGREFIARAFVEPARHRLSRAPQRPQEARRLCLTIEGLISIFPVEERFNTTLISFREILIELYSFLSPNYEVVIDRARTEPYQGPRPTRFERLLEQEESEEPAQQGPVESPKLDPELASLFHQRLSQGPLPQSSATISCHYCGKEGRVPTAIHDSLEWISELPTGWLTSNPYGEGFRFSCSHTCAQNESDDEGLKSL